MFGWLGGGGGKKKESSPNNKKPNGGGRRGEGDMGFGFDVDPSLAEMPAEETAIASGVDEARLQEALRLATMFTTGSEDNEDIEVEFTEEDMQDPALLSELSALEGGGGGGGVDAAPTTTTTSSSSFSASQPPQQSHNAVSTTPSSSLTTLRRTEEEQSNKSTNNNENASEWQGMSLEELEQRLASEKQRCVMLKRAGNVAEALSLLNNTITPLQALTQQKRLKATTTTTTTTTTAAAPLQRRQEIKKPEEEAKGRDDEEEREGETGENENERVVPQATANKSKQQQRGEVWQPPPSPQPQKQQKLLHAGAASSSSVDMEAMMQQVKARYDALKAAYLACNELEEDTQAHSIMQSMKVVRDMANQLKNGIAVDLSKLPPLPSQNIAQALSPVDVLELQRVKGYEVLEEDFKARIRELHDRALKLKDSELREEKVKAMELHKEKKVLMQELQQLVAAKNAGHPIPKHHYETKTTTEEIVFAHLRMNELEVSIVGCTNLPVPTSISSPDTYVYITFPYPSAQQPQKAQTDSVKGSINPSYETSFKFNIDRGKKSFLFFCQRKKLLCEIYHKRFLQRHILLGRAELNLSPLLSHSESHVQADVLPPQGAGRRPTGGKLEARLRLRVPLEGKDLRRKEERVLVIDSYEPVPTPTSTGSASVSSSASSASYAPSAPSAVVSTMTTLQTREAGEEEKKTTTVPTKEARDEKEEKSKPPSVSPSATSSIQTATTITSSSSSTPSISTPSPSSSAASSTPSTTATTPSTNTADISEDYDPD
ncbi:Coiled-coil and C2 domain-containing protein 1A, partial [Balamuthia mandrillaris]